MTSITNAVALKKDLDKLRPISKADELRIMQKFRLDWNFHSNNLEGNSLTYGETKALIVFGITDSKGTRFFTTSLDTQLTYESHSHQITRKS